MTLQVTQKWSDVRYPLKPLFDEPSVSSTLISPAVVLYSLLKSCVNRVLKTCMRCPLDLYPRPWRRV